MSIRLFPPRPPIEQEPLLLVILLFQIGTYQFLPRVKKKMQFLPQILLFQGVLVELVGRPKEHPVGLDDQLVEDRMAPKSEAETRLYELSNSRLP